MYPLITIALISIYFIFNEMPVKTPSIHGFGRPDHWQFFQVIEVKLVKRKISNVYFLALLR
jgi:hypothetical protein